MSELVIALGIGVVSACVAVAIVVVGMAIDDMVRKHRQ